MSTKKESQNETIKMDKEVDISSLNFDGVWRALGGENAEKMKKEYSSNWMEALSLYTMCEMAKHIRDKWDTLTKECDEETHSYLFAIIMKGLIQSVAENYYVVLNSNPHLLVDEELGTPRSICDHYSFITARTMSAIEERHLKEASDEKDEG